MANALKRNSRILAAQAVERLEMVWMHEGVEIRANRYGLEKALAAFIYYLMIARNRRTPETFCYVADFYPERAGYEALVLHVAIAHSREAVGRHIIFRGGGYRLYSLGWGEYEDVLAFGRDEERPQQEMAANFEG